MENVLEIYHRPEAATNPVVCVDETSKRHIKETREPLPIVEGLPSRYDSEYQRNGVSSLFMIFAPLLGFRHVEVTDRRTSIDFAHICRDLVDIHFRDAQKITLVCDNLNTHKPASLYKAFPAHRARRIAEKLEFHYTPKHGSWLNMTEIEFSVLRRQCLSRRIPDQETLKREVQAWQDRRNQQRATVNWRFTTQDARIKLKRLYPFASPAAASITQTSLPDNPMPSASLVKSTKTNSAGTASHSQISAMNPTPIYSSQQTHNAPEKRSYSSPKDSTISTCISTSTYRVHKKPEPSKSSSDKL